MFDLFKKTLFTGIGLVIKTRDEVEQLAREWAETQQMSEDEGRKFVNDMVKRYDSTSKELEEKIEEMVKRALGKANIALQEDVDALKKEIAALKAAQAAQTGTPQPPPAE